jgi:hypothetical protein
MSPHLEVLADAIRPHMPAIRNTYVSLCQGDREGGRDADGYRRGPDRRGSRSELWVWK